MKNRSNLSVVLTILLVIAVATAGWFAWQYYQADSNTADQSSQSNDADTEGNQTGENSGPTTDYKSEKGSPITVTRPLAEDTVSSPLVVSGTVPGSWSFEASFPVRLLDADRKELATAPATLNGDWMTDSQVPFSVELEFEAPTTGSGILVLERANPSDMPENADKLEIPVRFE